MLELAVIEKIIEKYEHKPVFRALVQLIPSGVGSAIEAGVFTQIQNIRAERMYTFFEELASGSVEISPELIKSEDFLHCYFSTVRAAINSRRREKIRLFARLLMASSVYENFIDTDEYEEYLQILDELSYREFMILFMLSEYEERFSSNGKEGLERAQSFWNSFLHDLSNVLKIQSGDIDPCLLRLTRTGCYELFMGKYFDVAVGQGQTTPRFHRLKIFVEEKQSGI